MSVAVETLSTPQPSAPSSFHAVLESMREHHLNRRGGDFFHANPHLRPMVAPAFAPALAGAAMSPAYADDPSVPEALRPVTDELKPRQQSVADAIQTSTRSAANDLKANKNVDAFHQALEAQRQKALKDSDDNINAAFDKAVRLGEANPALQGPILMGMNVVQNVISKFTSLINDLVGELISFVSDILNEIMSAVEGAFDAFGGAVESAFSFL